MIRVEIYRSGDSHKGFEVTGHAGYDDEGRDIVCAAVSILSYTVLNSLEVVAGINSDDIDWSVDEKTGFMKILLQKTCLESNILFKTFETGIKLLLENYSQYISLDYKEV
ncbi:hypothetical protein SAMN02745751_00711 [Dethiosulfatibacter aminovorans DSM 17477]|uniref:Ribosomal processing cysteine protease Prp n=1 Tax=Dethiosulfatibacter aminovorans DSM 17477 TaxID=1121476 RepID=A0A1M6CXC7_9FIRM|nr:ribosomal-processing cysteine protease Prp [Dethiosulfatibacter aminovorans]SHI65682.1 hypothetical protein SAMN02745751_00711 [Dethiosulfatibacter aminovorans DSM 17477]